jgi:hypothetical protein
LMNGVDLSGLTAEDAGEMANMLVFLRRAVPAGDWVDEAPDEAPLATFASLM